MQLLCKLPCRSRYDLPHGGLPDYEIRDITASLLTEVCHIMSLPSHPEHQQPCSAQYSCFWNNHQDAFFDVRVFYPNAPSNRSGYAYTGDTSKLKEGIRTKDQRDRAGSLHTPIVLSIWGGMGKEAATFYKRLADIMEETESFLTQL